MRVYVYIDVWTYCCHYYCSVLFASEEFQFNELQQFDVEVQLSEQDTKALFNLMDVNRDGKAVDKTVHVTSWCSLCSRGVWRKDRTYVNM
jgi:hypothetical protein